MGGGLLLASALACLALIGVLVAAMVGVGSPLRIALAAYVVAWATLVLTSAVLSLPQRLGRLSLTLALAIVALVAVVIWVLRGFPRLPRLPPTRATITDPIVRTLAVAVAIAGVYLAGVAFLTTPNDWDGLTYHETRALLWDQQDAIGYVPAGNDPRLNGNPPNAEIGLYLVLTLPRSERLAALPQFVALWACLAAVALIARRLGLPPDAAAYGGLVFVTLPIVLLQGAANLNDLVVAAFLLASVAFFLDRGIPALTLGAVSLGLALGTKLNAVLALPLVVAVVLPSVPRARRGAVALALAGGIALGSPWYVLNAFETDSLDGGLSTSTGQSVDRSFAAVVGTLRALTFDIVDTSGFWRSELYLAILVGAALLVTGVAVRARSTTAARALVGAGLVVAVVPLALRSSALPARWLWQHGLFKLGHEELALAYGDAWDVLGRPDTSRSWYGAAGCVVILGGIATTAVAVRRTELPRSAVVLSLAPLILISTFALTIVYDPWRGRLLAFAVGLSCASWGWTLRVRWLSAGIATLCVLTVALALVHSYTKPSGVGLLESPQSPSVWHRDRIDTLTVIRDYDGTPALLRAIEVKVPAVAELTVAAPIDTFLFPLASPRLSRTLRLVADDERVPADAAWVVIRDPAVARGCPAAWATISGDAHNHWRLLRRIAADTCGGRAAGL